MAPGWVPAGWRDSRLIYNLCIDGLGAFVDLTAADSIASINKNLGDTLDKNYGAFPVTLANLTGEDRNVTTAIASWIRELILDDGSFPLGVKFHTKHGNGICWAYWLRRVDDNLGPEPIAKLSEDAIHAKDESYQAALRILGIESR